MIIGLYLILLVTAILVTFLVLIAGSKGRVGGITVDPRVGIALSGLAVVLWGLIAINSYEISMYSGGEEFVQEYEQMAWLSIVGGAVGMYALLQAAIEEIGETGGV